MSRPYLPAMPRRLITERHVLEAAAAGRDTLLAPPGTLVTALARDAARARGVRFVDAPPEAPAPDGEAPPTTLALGCDHAGFAYKDTLKAHAEGLGWHRPCCTSRATRRRRWTTPT